MGGSGGVLPRKFLKFEARNFLHSEQLNLLQNVHVLTILVFEIKEGKNQQKVKKKY
jgi:hypothetical protein